MSYPLLPLHPFPILSPCLSPLALSFQSPPQFSALLLQAAFSFGNWIVREHFSWKD